MTALPEGKFGLEMLARDPASALEIGKAAEHLVCADLILSGYRAYLSDQGLPYDVVVDLGDRLVRIQVKATCFPKNVNAQGRNERVAYSWGVRRRGRGGSSRLDSTHCDIVALVALDVRVAAYLPIAEAGETVQLMAGDAPRLTIGGRKIWSRRINEFPFDKAISGSSEFYAEAKVGLIACPHGHPYTEENTIIQGGGRGRTCRECGRISSRERARRNRARRAEQISVAVNA